MSEEAVGVVTSRVRNVAAVVFLVVGLACFMLGVEIGHSGGFAETELVVKNQNECLAALLFLDVNERNALRPEDIGIACDLDPQRIIDIEDRLRGSLRGHNTGSSFLPIPTTPRSNP